ncbi:hypothetical protein BDP27DRAFT_1361238 [Rhodocollybia butyracea]|uniref:Uncharacterized protein n=1 Tax=Rhodocollybia butyracea TaxID=206335 RepID=A0A9P5PZN1_9AGAR|nr:hypothetical protein BDP27DRAFT_1361238 [Rhodocollybia butyracea]
MWSVNNIMENTWENMENLGFCQSSFQEEGGVSVNDVVLFRGSCQSSSREEEVKMDHCTDSLEANEDKITGAQVVCLMGAAIFLLYALLPALLLGLKIIVALFKITAALLRAYHLCYRIIVSYIFQPLTGLIYFMCRPEFAYLLNNLSLGSSICFEQSGHPNNLVMSIQLGQEEAYRVSHAGGNSSLNSLGVGPRNCIGPTGHHRDHDKLIHSDRDVLLLYPVGHPVNEDRITGTQVVLFLCLMGTAIFLLRVLLLCLKIGAALFPLIPLINFMDKLGFARLLPTLSLIFNSHSEQRGHLENLVMSIQLGQEEAERYPVGHPGGGSSLNNLSGVGLWNRFGLTGPLTDLDDYIQPARGALVLWPVGHPGHGSLNNLDVCLWNHFQQTGHLEYLNESIQLGQDELFPHYMGHPGCGSLLSDLVVCLWSRFQQTGHLEDLNESIQLGRDALLLHPVGHPGHGSSLNNLTTLVWASGVVSSRQVTSKISMSLLSWVNLHFSSIRLLATRAVVHHSTTSVCLWNRFQQTGDLADLENSIALCRDALLLLPVGHLGRGSSLNNLSMGLWNCFQQTGHLEDLDESI